MTVLLTVGEIAEQLRPIAPDTSATIERIRHWTREQLLSPVAQHHAGTGRHRRYAEESVYDSAILSAIANAGIPIVTQGYLREALSLARGARLKWIKAKSKDKDLSFCLEISMSQKDNPTVRVHDCTVKHDPTAELSIILNLSKIFAHVQRGMRERHLRSE